MEEEYESFDVSKVKKPGNKKFEMVLLLVLGVLVGFSAKTEAAKRITMGSSDYLLSQKDAGAYDLNAIQKNLTAKGDGAGASIAGPQMQGGSCGQ